MLSDITLTNSETQRVYDVKLDGFEGPLDLLLHLIQNEEMNINDIQIAKITDQYLDYVNLMDQLDLDVASEFLVMAATLLHIKSQSILPQIVSTVHPIGNQQQLVQQLLEYKRFKGAAQALDVFAERRTAIYNRSPELHADLDGSRSYEIRTTLFDLLTAFKNINDRISQLDPDEQFHTVEEDNITVEEKIDSIQRRLASEDQLHFDSLFPLSSSKIDLIVTFLAILELIRIGTIVTVQTGLFESIYIVKARVESGTAHNTSPNE